MSLFDTHLEKYSWNEPLAYFLRPKSLEEFFGQSELVSDGKLLRTLIERDTLHSVIFYGPPGSGKTTLASIIAEVTKSDFEVLSAVTGGVPELRKIIQQAKGRKKLGNNTILFIDEIHRFTKAQQYVLLPHVEDGTVVLIGATTDNPSFEVIAPLLSRSQVFVFKALGQDALKKILDRALMKAKVLMQKNFSIEETAQHFLIQFSNGDARILLNNLEVILKLAPQEKISLDFIQKTLQRKNLRYDKKGDEHYNIISALHKSMRDSDPDGALYWMVRMLEGGEDPLYIVRRLIRFASEDIGMADPHALSVAVAAKEACHFVGMPECGIHLAQAVVYLSIAPKSNALYDAYSAIQRDIEKFGNLEVPFHLRNAPTQLMKSWGYGRGYKYAHDDESGVVQQKHLPFALEGRIYYKPTDRGIEAKIQLKLEKLRAFFRSSHE